MKHLTFRSQTCTWSQLFWVLPGLILNFYSERIQSWCVTIQVKAIQQYIHVVLFIMLYKVVRTFKSGDEILASDHSNESYWVVLSCGGT